MNPPPIPSHAAVAKSSFARQAASFSLFAPLVAIAIGIFGQPQVRGNRSSMIILGLTSIFLIFGGFILGIAALLANRHHKFAGVFGRAIAGTCICGFLILLMLAGIPGLIRAAERAKAMQKQKLEQRQE